MSLRIRSIAVACTGLFAGASALAQVSSVSARIDQFSYELVDLDLTDRITPALSFREFTYSESYYDDGGGVLVDVQYSDTFGNTAVARGSGAASTSSSRTSLSAEAGWAASSPQFQKIGARNSYGWEFDITPATGVLFRAVATIDVAHGDDSYAQASVNLNSYFITPENAVPVDRGSFDSIYITQGADRLVMLGYLESGDEGRQGVFSISNDVFAQNAAAVPEPAGWAMLLAGLALLGRGLRRGGACRRAQAACDAPA